MSNSRCSNIELLRIVLILMIIVLHYFNGGMGGLLGNVEKWSLNFYLSHFLESLCIIAVNVFVIITGYFSYKKTSIKIAKTLNLYTLSVFYGIIISGIIIFLQKNNLNLSLAKTVATTIFSRWFVVIYCILYLLIPYINKLISNLNKKQLKALIIINSIFFYLWHTFFTNTTIADGGYGIVNFINLYIIGAYIRLYGKESPSRLKSSLIYFGCTLITTLYSFFVGRAWAYSTIFNLVSSIAFFELFRGMNIKNSKIINSLASYSFAVYIIHENSFFVKILYRNIFKSDLYWNSNYMILNLIISTIGIYITCIVIEFVRRLLLKKIMDDNIDKIKYEIGVDQ